MIVRSVIVLLENHPGAVVIKQVAILSEIPYETTRRHITALVKIDWLQWTTDRRLLPGGKRTGKRADIAIGYLLDAADAIRALDE